MCRLLTAYVTAATAGDLFVELADVEGAAGVGGFEVPPTGLLTQPIWPLNINSADTWRNWFVYKFIFKWRDINRR